MRISRRKPKPKQADVKQYRRNRAITAEEVRLINDTGENIGVMATSKALAMAQEDGLDLIEVSPLAKPPVVKIVDYTKFKYQEEKERRKERAHQKKVEVKGIRLSLRIGTGDLTTRLKQAEKFLGQENKVKIELILKGRERRHVPQAREIIQDFINKLNETIEVNAEGNISQQGGKLSVVVGKK